jgi:hypothetical protein
MQKHQLVDAEAAGEFLGVSTLTLQAWRFHKRYNLPYVKIGSRVMYDVNDLAAFVESRKVRPTEPELATV